MRRLFGWLLFLHGLAHAGPGMWTADRAPVWVVTALWTIATVGFVVAGFGLLGIGPFRRPARIAALAGAAASIPLLALLAHPIALIGIAADLAILVAVFKARDRWVGPAPIAPRHPALAAIRTGIAVLFLGYVTSWLLLRPWGMRWGADQADLRAGLPGDSLVTDPHYRIDHVVTIHAPIDSVWPWLVQIGQDRAGFYSYDWLERLAGADVHNADRIMPEWQRLAAGDLVRAVPPDWLGGRFGREIGWRVQEFVPGRAFVLQGWGAFVLRPVDSVTTRFHVRTRGDGRPALTGVFFAPAGLLAFEPAHFIMERGMLRGMKARVEGGRTALRGGHFRSAR